jgi:hypothetical protein
MRLDLDLLSQAQDAAAQPAPGARRKQDAQATA